MHSADRSCRFQIAFTIHLGVPELPAFQLGSLGGCIEATQNDYFFEDGVQSHYYGMHSPHGRNYWTCRRGVLQCLP